GRESRDLQAAKAVLDHESAEAEARLRAIDEQIIDFTTQEARKHVGKRNGPVGGSEDKLEENILQLRGQLSEVRSMIADAKAQLTNNSSQNFLPTDKYGSGASLATLTRQEYILSLRLDSSQKLLAELRAMPDDHERAQRVVDDLYKRKEFEYHIYSDLRKESLNIDIQASSARNKVKILDRPTLGAVRTGENLKPLMVKRCFMAALVALMIVFFREMFNPLIRDRRELDNLGLYYVGSVPNMNRNKRLNIKRSLRDTLHWLKHLGEPRRREATINTFFEMIFKNIAARILNYHDGSKPAPKVISVMSSASAEGKTTLAESLARVLAKSGKRTLLVDCDLRRRTLSRRMAFSNEVGISDFLQNSAEKFKNPVVKVVDKNFEFIPAGTSSVDAMELISGANYIDFLEAMRHHYEIIVIDTPPCIPCSEVIPIANASDMVMLSVNLDTTILSNVEDTIEKLNLRDKVPLAYVLNMDSAAESFSYYSDYFILPQRPVKTAV
ncbi:MAG: AAA family ATPase, partial [Bdellovibrionota bacterium]